MTNNNDFMDNYIKIIADEKKHDIEKSFKIKIKIPKEIQEEPIRYFKKIKKIRNKLLDNNYEDKYIFIKNKKRVNVDEIDSINMSYDSAINEYIGENNESNLQKNNNSDIYSEFFEKKITKKNKNKKNKKYIKYQNYRREDTNNLREDTNNLREDTNNLREGINNINEEVDLEKFFITVSNKISSTLGNVDNLLNKKTTENKEDIKIEENKKIKKENYQKKVKNNNKNKKIFKKNELDKLKLNEGDLSSLTGIDSLINNYDSPFINKNIFRKTFDKMNKSSTEEKGLINNKITKLDVIKESNNYDKNFSENKLTSLSDITNLLKEDFIKTSNEKNNIVNLSENGFKKTENISSLSGLNTLLQENKVVSDNKLIFKENEIISNNTSLSGINTLLQNLEYFSDGGGYKYSNKEELNLDSVIKNSKNKKKSKYNQKYILTNSNTEAKTIDEKNTNIKKTDEKESKEKESDKKESKEKETEEEETEEKESKEKESDEKKVDEKKADEKKADEKKADKKESKEEETDEEETDEEESKEKESDEKKADEKKADEKKADKKETDEKKADEKKTKEKDTEEKDTEEEETEEEETDEKKADKKSKNKKFLIEIVDTKGIYNKNLNKKYEIDDRIRYDNKLGELKFEEEGNINLLVEDSVLLENYRGDINKKIMIKTRFDNKDLVGIISKIKENIDLESLNDKSIELLIKRDNDNDIIIDKDRLLLLNSLVKGNNYINNGNKDYYSYLVVK